MPTQPSPIPLGELPLARDAVVTSIARSDTLGHRLMQLGLVEGVHVRIIHEAPWARDPVVVLVNDTRIALRRADAASILVTEATRPGALLP